MHAHRKLSPRLVQDTLFKTKLVNDCGQISSGPSTLSSKLLHNGALFSASVR